MEDVRSKRREREREKEREGEAIVRKHRIGGYREEMEGGNVGKEKLEGWSGW